MIWLEQNEVLLWEGKTWDTVLLPQLNLCGMKDLLDG